MAVKEVDIRWRRGMASKVVEKVAAVVDGGGRGLQVASAVPEWRQHQGF